RLLDVDHGFRSEEAATWRIETGQTFTNSAQQAVFYEKLLQQIEALPGVESAGLTDTLPLSRNRSWGVRDKRESYEPGRVPIAFPRIVGRGYLQAMRIPLRAGRYFAADDTADSEDVMIVNETMA